MHPIVDNPFSMEPNQSWGYGDLSYWCEKESATRIFSCFFRNNTVAQVWVGSNQILSK